MEEITAKLTLGVFRWSVIVVEPVSAAYLPLGIASTVHGLEEKKDCGNQEGGWAYHYLGQAFHNNCVVKENLPIFRKRLNVTFLLDLTGDGTLSALWVASHFTSYFWTCFP
jgi:hypothetical protein